MAPKDLWPNADMFFKQVKERKRREKLGLKSSIQPVNRAASDESPLPRTGSGSPMKTGSGGATPLPGGNAVTKPSTAASGTVGPTPVPAAVPTAATVSEGVPHPPLSAAPSASSIPFSHIEVDHVSVQSDLADDEASIATEG